MMIVVRRRTGWMWAGVMLSGLAVAACGGGDSGSEPSAAATAVATPLADPALASAQATGLAQPYDPTAEEMQQMEHLAFIKAVVPGAPVRIVLDTAVWLGDEASIADGNTNELDALPNNYYIRNLDPATVTLPVSPTAGVELIQVTADGSLGQDPLRVGVDALAGWYAGTPVPGAMFFGTEASKTGHDSPPMIITTRDGTVVRIQEQHVP